MITTPDSNQVSSNELVLLIHSSHFLFPFTEFIEVGKNLRALEILSDVLKSRKHRVWQAKHEEIMYKFLELCVNLQKSFVAKEGLYQYKIICQQTYIKSFEEVVRKFLEMAEAKATEAREKCKTTAEIEVEDLDNVARPEEILLCAVSSEGSTERNERVVLLPWVKFLWDTYRHCLELLRNNPRTERLYHDIAYQTFQFCIKYNRKPEMRKLCDNLHTHLEHLKKLQANASAGGHQNIISLNNPESQGMHLETRLVQLDCAIQMELWQEAYKATDDIKKFGLMSLARKQPKPQLMASYYQKLSLVFWKANSPLFHAAALLKHFQLSKELKKNITAEDIERMASRVVFAALSIPIPPNRLEIDKIVDTEENVVENHQKNLSSLLGLSSVPTRTTLLRDMEKLGVLQYAYPSLQELYRNLEQDFNPLQLAARVQNAIDFVSSHEQQTEFTQYIGSLKEVTIIRLLKEISQVYQTLQYSRLIELCPFVNSIYMEQMLVAASRRNDLQVRIDHRKQCLYFGNELRITGSEEIIEGPHLQSSSSDLMRKRLVNMYSTLSKARAMIEPHKLKSRRDEIKHLIMDRYVQHAEHEHKALLERQDYIEKKREELELKGIEREKEERRELEERQQRLKEVEEERLRKEAEEREVQQRLKEVQELQKKMARDQIMKMKQTDAGQRILNDIGEEAMYELKPEEIKSRQWKQIEKERREAALRQKKIEKKVDHLERAKRLEEIPLLKAEYEEWKVKDKEIWAQLEHERILQLEQEREQALKHKERLMRMVSDTEIFIEQVQKVRHDAFLARFAQWEKSLDEEREMRLAERKQNRKEERRREYFLEKQRAEAKRLAEEARKRREEELEEAKRLAELQMQREKQAEERREQRRREEQEERKRSEDIHLQEDKDWAALRSSENRPPALSAGVPLPGRDNWNRDGSRFPAGRQPPLATAVADRDFSDLRKPRAEPEVRAPLHTREEKDFGNLRNRPEEKDLGSIRNRPERDEKDFASMRTRPEREERDFSSVRNRPVEEKDFGNLRNRLDVKDSGNLHSAPRDLGESRPPREFGESRPSREFGENRPPREFGNSRNRDNERDFSNLRSGAAPRENRDSGDRMDRFAKQPRGQDDNWRRGEEKKEACKAEPGRPFQPEADDTEWRTVQKKR